MIHAATQEAHWRDALMDAHAPVPPGLHTWNGSDPATRFDVHRNNVIVTLVAALAETFPAVRALVGDDRFAEAARRYVRAEPPHSPVLAEYGAGWPEVLAREAAGQALPFLPDLARLEFQRVQAFHAADAVALAPARLAAALERPDDLAASRWTTHPSLCAIESDHPIVDLWAAHQGHGALESVDPAVAQSALVGREGDDVLVLALPRPAARFVAALQRGATLGEAVAQAGDDLDLPAILALLLSHGWLVEPPERSDLE